jgi:hypothetical protein
MLKKVISIILLFTALAILLGHNVSAHEHHDYEKHHLEQHHSDDHSHSDQENESKDFDFRHIFSAFQHGEGGITFLNSQSLSTTFLKQAFTSTAVFSESCVFSRFYTIARQQSPLYKLVCFNSQQNLPSGLRAPPIFIA